MTTTVGKGANRPAAKARTAKAAQRTPLPPRKGQITDEQIQQAAHIVELQNMGVVALRKYAREHGFSITGANRMQKDELLQEILAAEDAPVAAQGLTKRTAETLVSKLPTPAKQAVKGDKAKAVPSQKGTKSETKAADFLAEAKLLSWAGTSETSGETTKVTVTRGAEAIEITWINGVFQGDSCVYQHAGRSAIKVHNASAAKKRMGATPDQAQEEAQKVTAHKAARAPKKTPLAARRSKLPFTDASMDQEVLDAVYGKFITWVNGTSDTEDTDRVPTPQEVRKAANAPKIGEGPRGRFITFTGQSGFRDVLVSSIVRVR